MWLLLPFVLLPIIEIALFIQVGGWIGVLPTILLVMLSSVMGVAVMRQQGAMAALDIQRAMREMRDPAKPMAHGALIMLGGGLMVVPGLFTSAIGLLLMVPAIRSLAMRWLGRRVRVHGAGFRADYMGDAPSGHARRGDGVIDGEYSVQDDPPAPVREGLTDQTSRGKSGWTRH